jgi:hypothetical protein
MKLTENELILDDIKKMRLSCILRNLKNVTEGKIEMIK